MTVRKPLKLLIFLVALLIVVGPQTRLAQADLSIEQEKKMGRQFMKKVTLLLLLIIIFVLANCQDKSTPQKQPAFQGQNLASENEVRFLQDMVTNNPDNINAWIKLGNVFMDTQQYNGAIDAYQKALEINPDITNIRVDMGTCYRRTGRPDKAIEEYKKRERLFGRV